MAGINGRITTARVPGHDAVQGQWRNEHIDLGWRVRPRDNGPLFACHGLRMQVLVRESARLDMLVRPVVAPVKNLFLG